MTYDIILIIGERVFDHPLCGPAIIRRLLEKRGFSVGLIEMPRTAGDIARLGSPRLFFGVSSGSIDSMLRNYTPLKKVRKDDPHFQSKDETVPNRAVIVFCNWIREQFKDAVIVLGGVEATMRRFVHYDYWDNRLRRPLLFDSRADILAYGSAEKQAVEIAERLNKGRPLDGIPGTCLIRDRLPEGFAELPSFEEVSQSTDRFCDFQNGCTPLKDLAQKIDNRFVLQIRAPVYTPHDLDEYYELPFTRKISGQSLQGFEWSVVTHRGCIGECHFCSLSHTQGNRIVSRSEDSILREVDRMARMERFRGNVEDLGGATANMYGMDCGKCETGHCLSCKKLDKSHGRLIRLLRKVRAVKGVKKVFIRSGIRHDLATEDYVRELVSHHIFDTLRIAPEHVNPRMLKLMNKGAGDLNLFLHWFKKTRTHKKLSFYFLAGHPGSTMEEARELADFMGRMENAESFQLFTPTPGTVSTCMYYTETDPSTQEKIPVPKSYVDKKEQKRLILNRINAGKKVSRRSRNNDEQ